MQKAKLGKTAYQIFPVVYAGIVSMDEQQEDSDRYVAKSVEQGVNYFDVAPSYGNAELILGKSLRPYRQQVYLACKTTQRDAKSAKTEFHQSLKNLHTDYFDLYQLHSLSSLMDVEQAFNPGGTMELLVGLKKQGYIRKLGFSAHSEAAALEALKRYPFDSVMFPMNYLLYNEKGMGEQLILEKQRQDFGLLAIKALVERAWKDGEDPKASPWPKSWCKPFDQADRAARLAGMKFALSLGADALIPPGNWECQQFMVDNIAHCLENPYSEEDRNLLAERVEENRAYPFF